MVLDTIIALSSGHLPSGVGIIRCSGPKARHVVERLGRLPEKARFAEMQILRNDDGQAIDSGLVIWFPAPNSFTGEDVIELQMHGSRAVIAKILGEATAIEGVRLAEAGEFARQAFSNGKIDLTEAEGLADLIEAETEAQRKMAHILSSGQLRELYNGWQDKLLNARAMIEADIDFADEDDVPGSVADQVWAEMDELRAEIIKHQSSYGRSERIRNGIRVGLIGKPNVGKSSLLNALSGSQRAIVSEQAGTTRDVLEVRLDLNGYLVLLNDTAGIRDGAKSVEAEGIRRSIETANQSDLVLYLSDEGAWSDLNINGTISVLHIQTKMDLKTVPLSEHAAIGLSTQDEASVERFIVWLGDQLSQIFEISSINSGLRHRYMDHLRGCVDHLTLALEENTELELRAEQLRLSAFSLGRITGQYDTEDVLGRIFSSFCIGK